MIAKRITILACVALATHTSADILNTYTDITAFSDATTDLTTITFDTFGLSDSDATLYSGFDTTQGLFLDGEVLLTGKDHNDPSRNTTAGLHDSTFATTDHPYDGVTFVLDAPATAFGLNVGTLLPGTTNLTATIELASGSVYTFSPTTTMSFLGFTLDAAEDEISIFFNDMTNEAGTNRLTFDDLAFGQSKPAIIPAPAAGLLAVVGFGTIAAIRKRES